MVTDRCDGHCLYCRRAGPSGEDLDSATWLDLLDQAAAAGCFRVSFTGGEPLLRPDLPRLVRHARKLGMKVNLNTHGGLLPARIEELDDLSSVTISLDGPAPVMDALRGPGSHARAVRGIRAARRVGLPVTLHATIARANVEQVDAIVGEARRMGLRINMAPVTPTPLGDRGDQHYPEPEVFQGAIQRVLEQKRRGERALLSSTPCLEHLASWPTPQRLPCAAGRIYTRIEPDGTLHSCGDLLLQHAGVSALEHGFEAAFRRLPAAGCDRCWCDTRVEMNLVYGLNPSALLAARDR